LPGAGTQKGAWDGGKKEKGGTTEGGEKKKREKSMLVNGRKEKKGVEREEEEKVGVRALTFNFSIGRGRKKGLNRPSEFSGKEGKMGGEEVSGKRKRGRGGIDSGGKRKKATVPGFQFPRTGEREKNVGGGKVRGERGGGIIELHHFASSKEEKGEVTVFARSDKVGGLGGGHCVRCAEKNRSSFITCRWGGIKKEKM